jgi:hypothetical protein
MREGELFITVTGQPGFQNPQDPNPIFPMSAMERPMGSFIAPPEVSGKGPFWRERTGRKKGLLFKRDETKEFKISGLRCTECGYVELFVC